MTSSEPSLAGLRDRFREANGITQTHRRVEWLDPGPIPIPNPPVSFPVATGPTLGRGTAA